uniref:Uncharacterized protein n=1 Tax=Caenorhabditis japonica TaxID=281687 RepID=A0A8R1E6M1_CAEJA
MTRTYCRLAKKASALHETYKGSVSVYIRSCFFVNFSIVNVAFSDFPTLLPKKRAAATKEKIKDDQQ